MSLSIEALTDAVALGPRAAMLATALEPAGADFVSGDEKSLTFDLELEDWAAAYGLDRIEREFPGLYVQIQHSQVFGDAVVWQIYESMLTVSLPDFSVRAVVDFRVRVVVEGSEMGDCDCDEGDCPSCLRRGELPKLEEALEEYYRPIVAEALAALALDTAGAV